MKSIFIFGFILCLGYMKFNPQNMTAVLLAGSYLTVNNHTHAKNRN